MTTGRIEGYGPTDPAYRRVTLSLFLAGLATFATIYCTQPLLPILSREFSVSPGTAALSVSVTTICLGCALLFVGPLSDALGRTRIMNLSLVASGLACLACAFVNDWTHLLILRGIEGFLVAGLPAIAAAYLREEIHRHWASAVTGLYIGGTAIGGMSGRLIAGALADFFGWRVAIGALGVLSLVIAGVVWFLLPRSRRFRPVDLNYKALSDAARRMLFDRGLFTLYLIGFTTIGSFVACFNAIGYRLAAAPYRLSVGATALIFLTYAIGSVASAWASRIASAHGSRAVVPVTVLIFLAGILLTLAEPLPLVIAGVGVVSIGFFSTHGVVSGWVSARASLRGPGVGQAGAFYLFSFYLGSSVCGTLAGTAWSAGGWPAVVALCGGLLVVAWLLALSMRGVPVAIRVTDSLPPHP